MKKAIFIVSLLVAHCGQENSNNSSDSQSATLDPASLASLERSESFARNVGARLVKEKEDLAECFEEINGTLIYVKSEKIFYYCSPDEGGWTQIDIKGDKGKDGDKGEQGIAGAKGEKGEQGIAGQDGQNGQDAPVVDTNEWVNPITGAKVFIIGTIKVFSWIWASSSPLTVKTTPYCTSPYTRPLTDQEALDYAGLGMLEGLNLSGQNVIYGRDIEDPGAKYVHITSGYAATSTYRTTYNNTAQIWPIICIIE